MSLWFPQWKAVLNSLELANTTLTLKNSREIRRIWVLSIPLPGEALNEKCTCSSLARSSNSCSVHLDGDRNSAHSRGRKAGLQSYAVETRFVPIFREPCTPWKKLANWTENEALRLCRKTVQKTVLLVSGWMLHDVSWAQILSIAKIAATHLERDRQANIVAEIFAYGCRAVELEQY